MLEYKWEIELGCICIQVARHYNINSLAFIVVDLLPKEACVSFSSHEKV